MKVIWKDSAMDDRIAIFDRISAENFDAAVRMDDEIEEQVELLEDFREMGRTGRVGVLES